MNMMYYCKKCHNIVFSEEDLTRKTCFQCEGTKLDCSMLSEQEYEEKAENGELGNLLDEMWGYSPKRFLMCVQSNPDELLYCNEKTNEIVSESGNELKPCRTDILNWKFLLTDSLKLGRCGELYVEWLLGTMGYEVYHPLVDNHGVDLIAQKANGQKLRVQVKTVKAGNYSFIQKEKFYRDKDFAVFYIRVDKDGVPSTFVYPSKVWPEENSAEISYSYDGRFTFHPYSDDCQKSKAEYGISGAEKYYSCDDFFCVDTDDMWLCDRQKFDEILGEL